MKKKLSKRKKSELRLVAALTLDATLAAEEKLSGLAERRRIPHALQRVLAETDVSLLPKPPSEGFLEELGRPLVVPVSRVPGCHQDPSIEEDCHLHLLA